jgi:hypothetical protein
MLPNDLHGVFILYSTLDDLILQLFPLTLNFPGTLLLNYGQVAKDIENTMQIRGRPYLQERPKKVKYNAIIWCN